MTPDYVAAGTQYDHYMRLGELLNLQRRSNEWAHRDELLFQVVHQASELLLKLTSHELSAASEVLEHSDADEAARLVTRAAHDIVAVTALLEPLSDLRPSDFLMVRPVLGTGSGAESPGWRSVRSACAALRRRFLTKCPTEQMLRMLATNPPVAMYRLADAMIDLDQRICMWRARHYEILARILGEQVVGTAGTPVVALRERIHVRLFPELWQIRTALTERQDS